ncbi:MAG: hypothetical protein DMG37_22710 [Acidobacteria bacterium]|nr:MAG: hypothetical protein DMG37_22710 [Acidobacteriota bacterium]
MKRVPGLDGLRAVSILLVLCGPLDDTHGFYSSPALWGRIGDISISYWPAGFPQNLILAFAPALLCHYVIEKPFLEVRDARRPRSIPISRLAQSRFFWVRMRDTYEK